MPIFFLTLLFPALLFCCSVDLPEGFVAWGEMACVTPVNINSGHVARIAWNQDGSQRQMIQQRPDGVYDCKFCLLHKSGVSTLKVQVSCSQNGVLIQRVAANGGSTNDFLRFTFVNQCGLTHIFKYAVCATARRESNTVLNQLFPLEPLLVFEHESLAVQLGGERIFTVQPVINQKGLEPSLQLYCFDINDASSRSFFMKDYKSYAKHPKCFKEYFDRLNVVLQWSNNNLSFEYSAFNNLVTQLSLHPRCPKKFGVKCDKGHFSVRVTPCLDAMNLEGKLYGVLDISFDRNQQCIGAGANFRFCNQIQCVGEYAMMTYFIHQIFKFANRQEVHSRLIGRMLLRKSELVQDACVRPILSNKCVLLSYTVTPSVKFILQIPPLELQQSAPLTGAVGAETVLLFCPQISGEHNQVVLFKFPENITAFPSYEQCGVAAVPDIYIPQRANLLDVFQPRRLCVGHILNLARLRIGHNPNTSSVLLYYEILPDQRDFVMRLWMQREIDDHVFDSVLSLDVSAYEIESHRFRARQMVSQVKKQPYFHLEVTTNASLDFFWNERRHEVYAVADFGTHQKNVCTLCAQGESVRQWLPCTVPIVCEEFYRSDASFDVEGEIKKIERQSCFLSMGLDWRFLEILYLTSRQETLRFLMEPRHIKEGWACQMTANKFREGSDFLLEYQFCQASQPNKPVKMGRLIWKDSHLMQHIILPEEKYVGVFSLEISGYPRYSGVWNEFGLKFVLPLGQFLVFTVLPSRENSFEAGILYMLLAGERYELDRLCVDLGQYMHVEEVVTTAMDLS